MIDLKFTRTTIVGKPVPKNAFYKHLEVNAKIKQHFVDDVVSIHWLYKLAPSTINVEDGKQVHEIVVFSAVLKSKDCPDDVFLFIDQNMPRHVVFILEYDNRYKVLLNYKEWKDGQNGQFRIIKTFVTDWLTDNQLLLTLEGLNMDALYEALAGQVSGFGTKKAEDTKRIVEQTLIIYCFVTSHPYADVVAMYAYVGSTPFIVACKLVPYVASVQSYSMLSV